MYPVQNYNNYKGNHYKALNKPYNSGNLQLLPEQTYVNTDIKELTTDSLKGYYLSKDSLGVPWVTDPALKEALLRLQEVKFLPGDVEHMKKLGVNIIFKDGNEAIKFIRDNKINIKFGPVSDPKSHAQWDNESDTVIINKEYEGTKDLAEILAISEAFLHEIGHAKDKDEISSRQEEFDCLALNTLANRYHQRKYPKVFASEKNSAILNNGVCLYTKLFFDPDPEKKALKARIKDIYGNLQLESPNHPASDFIKSIN